MNKYQYKVQGVDYDVEIEEVEGNVAKVIVNGIRFDVELKHEPFNSIKLLPYYVFMISNSYYISFKSELSCNICFISLRELNTLSLVLKYKSLMIASYSFSTVL